MFDKAQAALDTAPIEDLKAAAQAVDNERVLANRMNRIGSTAPALSEKLNIPIKAAENLLMFNGL
jgi:C4-dicarboxylate-specific signal transduction histidine kinase